MQNLLRDSYLITKKLTDFRNKLNEEAEKRVKVSTQTYFRELQPRWENKSVDVYFIDLGC